MSPFTHPRLASVAAFLDEIRDGLAAVVTSSPAASLTTVPAGGGWSGAQIIQHLGKAEGSTAKFLEGAFAAAIAGGLVDETETTSVLGSLDRYRIDDRTLRPLVAPERVRPDSEPDLEASWTSLVAVRARTYRAFATVDGKALESVSAPHPLLGPLNGYEWLLFLGLHEQRHLGQLRALAGGK
ncbi:MAG: DinB family protein [Gemmatimonadetes bacterium]|nr:DinB family protein [Gemmatimonadota bacterium]